MSDFYLCDDCGRVWTVPDGVTLRCRHCGSKNRSFTCRVNAADLLASLVNRECGPDYVRHKLTTPAEGQP